MELAMSMFATSADYWKARAELAEATVHETARELGCEPDNELILEAAHGLKADAARYRWLRSDDIDVPHGQREICVYREHLPFADEPDELLIESALDDAIDAAMS